MEIRHPLAVFGLFVVLAILTSASTALAQAVRLHVDADSTSNGPGTEEDWSDAFKYLQDAIDWADTHPLDAFEIRVAEGIYKPNQAQFATIPTNQRDATFKIQRNDVVLLGGYAGVGAQDPNARKISLYQTILSGDLDDDDIPVNPQTGDLIFQNYDDNSYNVVTTTGVNDTVVIEGFTITGGNDDEMAPDPEDEFGLDYESKGGGMVNYDEASPIVRRCIFIHNSCLDSGGGMANLDYSNPVILMCDFIQNRAVVYSGGGMECRGESVPKIINCRFIENTADHVGGGVRMREGLLSQTYFPIVNCLFEGNYAEDAGGAIRIGFTANAKIFNCTIINNTAGVDTQDVVKGGGGISTAGNGQSEVWNTIIWGNVAADGYGAEINATTNPTTNSLLIYNCNVRDRNDTSGDAIYEAKLARSCG